MNLNYENTLHAIGTLVELLPGALNGLLYYMIQG